MLTLHPRVQGAHGLLSREGLAGLLLMTFAIAILWINSGLQFGTPRSMGPGFMPRFIAIALLLCGVIQAARAYIRQSQPVTMAELAAAPWRGIAAVTVSIVLFTLLLQPAGLLLAGFAMIVVLSFANEKPRLLETLIFATLVSFAVAALFVWGLRIRVPVWPTF
ncbi:MAG: hypothetical protein ABS76_12415 [Pelagibacterium sp. SCN 64-44]|nr:MAG: hypothetical protein ABS76_12415 [Pelagibacterium sp. SCN 64-44]